MYYNLFLDDDERRIPHLLTWIELPLVNWTIVRNYNDFVATIEKNKLPERISFDHDIAEEHYSSFLMAKDYRSQIDYSKFKEKTGYDAAKWLANYCLIHRLKFPMYYVHSLNNIGKENIISLIENYKLSTE